jgi:type IV secretory pathway VirJ component
MTPGWLRRCARFGATFVFAFGMALTPSSCREPGDLDMPAPLPLITMPARDDGNLLLALIITGDGGWAPADQSLAKALRTHGVAVVGLDAPAYLARARRPDELANDVGRLLRYYLHRWKRGRVIVIGYSRGADIAPFAITRLPADLRARIAVVALLGPGKWAGLQFHWMDLARDIHRHSDLLVQPEIEQLDGIRILCIVGREDTGSICPAVGAAGLARVMVREGGHGVAAREGKGLADIILAAVEP